MNRFNQDRMTVAVALVLPCAATLWLLTRSSMPFAGTSAMLAALLIATALIALNTWKNGQAAGSVGQLIHEVNVISSPPPRPSVELTSVERWDTWQRRGQMIAYTGQVRALLAFSVAATGALLFTSWRA